MLVKSAQAFLFCTALLLWPGTSWACLSCNRPLQVSVFDGNFWAYAFYLVLPLLVAGAIAARLYKLK
jgi:hypothetical protein